MFDDLKMSQLCFVNNSFIPFYASFFVYLNIPQKNCVQHFVKLLPKEAIFSQVMPLNDLGAIIFACSSGSVFTNWNLDLFKRRRENMLKQIIFSE